MLRYPFTGSLTLTESLCMFCRLPLCALAMLIAPSILALLMTLCLASICKLPCQDSAIPGMVVCSLPSVTPAPL